MTARLLLRIAFLVAVALPCVRCLLHAQRVDNRGTDFVIAFMPTNGYDEFPSLVIGVSSAVPTTGVLKYHRDGSTHRIVIPEANRTVWIDVDSSRALLLDRHADSVIAAGLSLHFDSPVTVIGANTMRWSGDLFLALPREALGREYMVLAYPSPVNPQSGAIGSDYPSQFAVVAVEDRTEVTIDPSTTLYHRSGSTDSSFSVILDSGEVYLGQAQKSTSQGPGRDVSGTMILASRPVAVFSGSQRGNVPWQVATGRDHMVEQMIPTIYWQSDAIVTPHLQLPKSIPDSNIVRVIAANNGTTVMVDGQSVVQLRSGEVLELPLDRAKYISATGPILVAQFQHSTMNETLVRSENDTIGDPTMILAPSPAQFDTSFVFQSPQTPNYLRHFINVIVRDGEEEDVVLDGFNLSFRMFRPVVSSGYSFAQIELLPGSHLIRSSTPFGLIVYGYGPYTAYGYPGGLVLARPPAGMGNRVEPSEAIVLSPNPATGRSVTLAVSLRRAGALRVALADLSGAPVIEPIERGWLLPGDHTFEIDISAVAAGTYILETTAAGAKSTRRLVVVR